MSRTQSATSRVSSGTIAISEKQRHGRAINAVAELLMRKLLVPKIFLEPKGVKIFVKPRLIPERGPFADIMAIDRAGSGDVYVAEVFVESTSDEAFLKRIWPERIQRILKFQPVHFFYVAVDSATVEFVSKQQLFADDGIGRIGVIEVVERPAAPPEARIAIPAERFRVTPDWITGFDDFQKKTRADMEFRD